ncbi:MULTISPECIES: SDR family NAD(P)-dependent oxidoreductase [Asaia]|uniref:SDR family NAD(P)-dependent oxidoreductase n=1 Tax=Asaia TaxID=91914 RepID=UPI0025543F2A|nr:SDR family NAD(P)-dependent oxidoreductase [Asaia sp. HumB]MDL2171573.1 SDR family NAD(P)-dependent oxidoreductase [Asaia sp. HumB]
MSALTSSPATPATTPDTKFNAQSTTDDVLAGLSLAGKRYLVTGVSAGLGVETARALVAHGAEVIGTARDLAKAARATASIDPTRLQIEELALDDLASVRDCAKRLLAQGMTFDAIIANAGVMATPQGVTKDGFETQFGTNHLGHFVLVNLLIPLVRPGGRVVMLSSAGHRYSDVDLEDPGFLTTDYTPFGAYGRSKTANILFAVALDARHKARGIRAVAMHPGGIATELVRHMPEGAIEAMIEGINQQEAEAGRPPFRFKTIPQGAASAVWAATVATPSEIGGRYGEDCSISAIVPDDQPLGITIPGVRAYAVDLERAEALWTLSEKMVGETFPAS